MTERYCLLPGYTPAGLSNQRMELEVKAALAMLTGRTLVLPNKIRAWRGPDCAETEPTVLDLMEIPFPYLHLADFERQYPDATVWELPWNKRTQASGAYFVSPAMRGLKPEVETAFANGRPAWTVDQDLEEELACGSGSRMLTWYSYFFLVSPEEFRQVRALAASIRPLSVYREFADDLARSLGVFHAVHIRRGDFLRFGVRIPEAEEILANLESVFPREDPLVICTDEPTSDYFRPLLDRYPRACFVESLFEEHPERRARYRELPFAGPFVDAIVTQLLAARAMEFAGTFYSTFTAYIHRERLLERNDRTFRFVSNPFPSMPFADCVFKESNPGSQSWNRLAYPVKAGMHSWVREWPEAFDGPQAS
jgi:hypothetical protein